jgi:hypothetical protein
MGKDKTSWLFDETDTDFEDEATGEFTETLHSEIPTRNHSGPGFSDSEAKTDFVQTTEKTEIYHGGIADKYEEPSKFDEVSDPTVGWFVVVKGPGLGQSVSLGSGMNQIGRDPEARVALPFGDTLISSSDHVRVIYDDESRSFLIAPGGGSNVTKVGKQIVATPLPLENYSLVRLSRRTHVRFVAFCNDDFDWSDLAEDEEDGEK